MILAVTGGRYDPTTGRRILRPPANQLTLLSTLLRSLSVTTLVHGAAIGTDLAVAAHVRAHHARIVIIPYPIVRRLDGEFPVAGHNRNRRMLRDSRAQGLVAFPGGSGTANCTSEAIAMGLSVWEWHLGDFIVVSHDIERLGTDGRWSTR